MKIRQGHCHETNRNAVRIKNEAAPTRKAPATFHKNAGKSQEKPGTGRGLLVLAGLGQGGRSPGHREGGPP